QASLVKTFDRNHDGKVTLIDLIGLYKPEVASGLQTFVSVYNTALNLVNSIPTRASVPVILLGSFTVSGDAQGAKPVAVGTARPSNPLNQLNPTERNFFKSGVQLAGGGFKFPLLEDPLKVFQLLLGKDVALFTFDLPTLKAGFSLSQFFPIIGPLGI